MRSLVVPFHFTTTFLVAVSAYAGVWLALSRPRFAPAGWARAVFGAGWLLLAAAETLHGAQVITTDIGGVVLALRAAAFLAILVSLVPTAWGGSSSTAAGPRSWAVGLGAIGRSAGPAVLGLGAALVALRSRLPGARRLALALGLLGASELFFAHGGAISDNPDLAWILGHGLQLLGGFALGVWLWKAFRVSLQARFVAALVLLLLLVIALISFTFTQVFARSVRSDAFNSIGAAGNFEQSQIASKAVALQKDATILSQIQGIPALVEAKSPLLKQIVGGQAAVAVDFFGFLGADGQYLAISVSPSPTRPATLTDTEVVTLSGSAEVRNALGGLAAGSIDDIGLGNAKLVLIGAAPVFNATTHKVVGAVVVGQSVNNSLLTPLAKQQNAAILDARGVVVATDLAQADQLVRGREAGIQRQVITGAGQLTFDVTIGQTPFYALATPLLRADKTKTVVVGTLVLTQEARLQSTEADVSRSLFLGALAATLFAVGIATISGSRMTRPIRDLTAAAERVRQGDLATRVPVLESDEVGALGTAFNQMTASLDGQAIDLRAAAVQESLLRRELETILQSMTDGLIAVDREGRVVTINREAERIAAVPGGHARGMLVQDLLSLVDSSGSPVDLPVFRLGPGSAAGYMPGPRSDVLGTPVAVTSAPITDESGLVSGAVAVVRDLTSEMVVDQMKTEFLSNISHELRTPLTPIKGYADLLRRKPVSRAKAVAFLNVIVASTERMERIVDMLVDFSAMQAGRLGVRKVRLNLDQVTAELEAKWRDAAPNHTVERRSLPGLPDVAGDARLLPRAIDELLDNAVKFSPDGGLISLIGELEGQEQVRLTVEDHGIGISAEEMSRIFQDFVQVDASETRAFGGLGLGLAYVRRIIEAHGGELQVESRAGEGARFSLLIPILRGGGGGPTGGSAGPEGTEGADEGSASRGAGGPEGAVPVAPMRRAGLSHRKAPPEWPRGR